MIVVHRRDSHNYFQAQVLPDKMARVTSQQVFSCARHWGSVQEPPTGHRRQAESPQSKLGQIWGGKSWLPSLLLAFTFLLFNRITIVGFSRQVKENPTRWLKQPKVFIVLRITAVRAAKVVSSQTSVSPACKLAASRAQGPGWHSRPCGRRIPPESWNRALPFSRTAPGECHPEWLLSVPELVTVKRQERSAWVLTCRIQTQR